jgi:mono/diheme cytochrome c family protein/uncharacterized cupredoxin-like copper-binding protein
MTDDRTGRELTPRVDNEVTPGGTQPGTGDNAVERFSAGPVAHTVGLTEERAAQIVRQSGNARNVAFLAFLLIALFIPIYWFYDIGVPALGVESRQQKEVAAQYISDVKQGYGLFQANCATCHGAQGQGGIGPPLNDQPKLYNAVGAGGKVGTGHLNANYIHQVLEVGGRIVCGDAKSVMPVWLQPGGPLNYRQVQELIAWITAANTIEFQYTPARAEGATGPAPTAVTVNGWRDPAYTPAPDASPVPACWRNPSGVIGGSTSAPASGGPIASPGTADNPRAIKLDETATLTITDEAGAKVSSLPVVAGEVIKFDITNAAPFEHNFYVGPGDALAAGDISNAAGVPAFNTGTQTFTYTVPATTDGTLAFGCTLPGHYQSMNGALSIQAAGGPAGSTAPASEAPAGSPAPSASAAP